MFKFEISKMSVHNVLVLSVTTALGGSITIVDQQASQEKGKRVTHRLEVPYAVARSFIKTNKQSRFLVPVEIAITRYEGMIVAIEKRLANAIHDDNGVWVSTSDFVLRRILPKVTSEGDWYIDGVSIYKVPKNWNDSSNKQSLTADGRFYAVTVSAIKLQNMAITKLMEHPATSSCVAFKHNGGVTLSPAIWSNVLDIRGTKATTVSDVKDDNLPKVGRFDALNEMFFVNLEFVLSSANKLGSLFGYEHIAFLELDRHMISLNTVNLPKVPKSIRSTYDTQKQFIVCLAWLLGYLNRCETLEQYGAIRGLIKTLCNKGLFDRKSTEVLFNQEPPQTKDHDEALVDIYLNWGELTISSYFMNKGDVNKVKSNTGEEIASVLTGVVD